MRRLLMLLFIAQAVLGVKKYFIPNIAANWHKAQEFCISLGMTLVSVESLAEHEALVKFIKQSDKFSNATRFWLGGSDLAKEGTYTWVSSARFFTFQNWADGEPNNGNDTEHCIEMIHNIYVNRVWQWNDINCRTFEAYFICESVDSQCIQNF
ncbi:perlucin-like protein [Toxorhynchites rutilus septentrionalis]|uniref:perlucin-like protein n=1 Tax=Toxorhynchites rutilus septentrionalis TaxID=329112 RepID=UPI00247AED5F|nr:perlucin-like protein [Toxorhynchites rutilus septentrionalis]